MAQENLIVVNKIKAQKYFFEPPKIPIEKDVMERNRNIHGYSMKKNIIPIKSKLNQTKNNYIFIDIESAYDHNLVTEQLKSRNKKERSICNFKLIKNKDGQTRQSVVLRVNKKGLEHVEGTIDGYIHKDTKKGLPRSNELIANIENLKLSTIKSFWTSPFSDFPNDEDEIWWEMWLRKSKKDEENVISQLKKEGGRVGGYTINSREWISRIEFSDQAVYIVKATAKQLNNLFLSNESLFGSLLELKKPQEVNSIYLNNETLSNADKTEFLKELRAKVIEPDPTLPKSEIPMVCLLDIGVTNTHILLQGILKDKDLYTCNPAWGLSDISDEHGTPMAGLVLYGDLFDILGTGSNVDIPFQLESVKISNKGKKEVETEHIAYGYQNAINLPIIENSGHPRIYCLTLTNFNQGFKMDGRPSTCSSILDNEIFIDGDNNSDKLLLLVTAGNVSSYSDSREYPETNKNTSIHDPAQAYNAITVGAYTRKIKTDKPKTKCLAKSGGMSPHTTTSITWNNSEWPIKPEIVMEGGNKILLEEDSPPTCWTQQDLEPLSVSNKTQIALTNFGATCSATALASRMVALIRSKYPDLWSETIRGLLIHSASWNRTMLEGRKIQNLHKHEKIELLRTFGYGVPNYNRAISSIQNRFVSVTESTIQPYITEGNAKAKYNVCDIYELPFPTKFLKEKLAETNVKLAVTLSYYIEPNPGEKEYKYSNSYQSHSLDFKINHFKETKEQFVARVTKHSKYELKEGTIIEDRPQWTLKQYTRRGSIKKDFLIETGGNIADMKYLCIYPKKGWYKGRIRHKKNNAEVRYSLVISVEVMDKSFDLSSPIRLKIQEDET